MKLPKSKRIKSFLLLLLLVLGLTGCFLWEEEKTEPILLRVALWDYDKVSYDSRMIDAFMQAHPEIQVEVISYADAYYDKKAEALLSDGTQVDVIYIRSVSMLEKLRRQQAVLELDAFLVQDGIDTGMYHGIERLRLGEENAVYAMPYRYDRSVLFYNRDMFDRAGIAYPQDGMTWQDFRVLAKELQEKACGAGEYALLTLPSPEQHMWQMSRGGAADSFDKVTALLWQINFMDKTMLPYAQAIETNVQQRLFESGRFGMYLGGSWFMNYLHSDAGNDMFTMNWGAVTRPVWEDLDRQQEYAVVTSLCISRASASPGAAWEFIKYISGEAGARIMAEERMIPAYIDEQVLEIFSAVANGQNISPEVFLFDCIVPSVIPSDPVRQQRGYDLMKRVLAGETRREDANFDLQ